MWRHFEGGSESGTPAQQWGHGIVRLNILLTLFCFGINKPRRSDDTPRGVSCKQLTKKPFTRVRLNDVEQYGALVFLYAFFRRRW